MTSREVTRLLGNAPSFIERFGHVDYRTVVRQPAHWKVSCLDESCCEMEGCRSRSTVYVFDHCHRHGWVRGVLCNGCNVKLGYLESVMSIPGVTVDLGNTAYGRFLANCPGGAENVASWLPGKGPFGQPDPVHYRTAAQRRHDRILAINPGRPVARPGARVAHLPVGLSRTVCGRVADAMTAAIGMPICRACASGVLPAALAEITS